MPMGRGSYRLAGDPASGNLLITIRPDGFDDSLKDDALVIAMPPPPAGQKAKVQLIAYTAIDRLKGTTRRVDPQQLPRADEPELGAIDRFLRSSARLSGEGWLGPVYVVALPCEMPAAHFAFDLEEVELRVETAEASGAPTKTTDAQHRWLSEVLANPEHIGRLARRAPPAVDPDSARWLYHERAGEPWRFTTIAEEGVYALRPASLTGADLPPNADRVRIWRQGVEVPTLLREGNLYFYGVPSDDPHTREARYWIEPLAADSSEVPLRMAESEALPAEATPTTLAMSRQRQVIDRDERVVTRRDRFLTILDYRWVERDLPGGKTAETTFDLPGLSAQIGAPSMRLELYATGVLVSRGVTLGLVLNGDELTSASLTLEGTGNAVVELPAGALRPSDNRLEITPEYSNSDGFEVWLDRIDVDYTRDHYANVAPFHLDLPESPNAPNRRVAVEGIGSSGDVIAWNVLNPLAPVVVPVGPGEKSGVVVATPSPRAAAKLVLAGTADAREVPALVAPTTDPVIDKGPADWPLDLLIVTHPEFREAAKRLAELHRREGRGVLVVASDAIASEFGQGPLTPPSLQRFLAHAATGWAHPPGAILLMGDCTQDHRGDFRNGIVNFIPAWRESPGGAGRAGFASDYPYTCLIGTDNIPDVPLARLSVANMADAEAIVGKLEEYASSPAQGAWQGRVAIVSDSGEFTAEAEFFRARRIPDQFGAELIRLGRMPWTDNFLFSKEELAATRSKISPAATTAVRKAFGAGLFALFYTGHGSPNIWSDERLWFGGGSPNSDNPLLWNAPALPFVVNFTCNTGAVDYPLPPWNICITEDMMRQRHGGALSVFAPGGLGTLADHRRMADELMDSLLSGGLPTVGEVTHVARARYALRGFDRDMLRMYILQGDPLTKLRRPKNDLRVVLGEGSKYAPVDWPSLAVSLQASAAFAGGQATLTLTDPDAAERHTAQVLLAPTGQWSGELPVALDREGTWRLHAHVANATGDIFGGASIAVGFPRAGIENVELTAAPTTLGGAAQVTVRVANQGELPVVARSLSLEVWHPGSAAEDWRPVERRLISLKPRQKMAISFDVTAAQTVTVWRAVLAGAPPSFQPATPRTRGEVSRQVAIAIVPPQPGEVVPPRVIPLTALSGGLEIPREASPRLNLEYWVALVRGSTDSAELAKASAGARLELRGPDGEICGTQEFRFDSFGRADALVGSFILPEGWKAGSMAVSVSASWLPPVVNPEEDAGPSAGDLAAVRLPAVPFETVEWQIPNDRIPNLVLRSMRVLTPDVGAGDTVMVEAEVANMGNTRAKRVALVLKQLEGPAAAEAARIVAATPAGSIPDPSGIALDPKGLGTDLVSLAGRDDVPSSHPALEPGESVTLMARWDPFEPAGPYVGALLVTHENGAMDLDPSDNVLPFAVRFRRPFELEFTGSPAVRLVPVDPRQRLVRLEATIANRGETEAQRVELRFYASDADRAAGGDPVAMSEVEILAPGSEAKVAVEWKLTAEQARDGVRPTVQAAVKGSRQRIVGSAD